MQTTNTTKYYAHYSFAPNSGEQFWFALNCNDTYEQAVESIEKFAAKSEEYRNAKYRIVQKIRFVVEETNTIYYAPTK